MASAQSLVNHDFSLETLGELVERLRLLHQVSDRIQRLTLLDELAQATVTLLDDSLHYEYVAVLLTDDAG